MRPRFYFLYAFIFYVFSLSAQDQTSNDQTQTTSPQTTTQQPRATNTRSQTDQEQLSLDKGTISNQFDYVISKSGRYQEYKVVREVWLSQLKSHVVDTLRNLKNELSQTNNLLAATNNTVDSLKSQVQSSDERMNEAIRDKNSISLLGIKTDKTVYNSIVFFVIAALAISLLIIIFLFKRSNLITVQTKKDLEETKDEFDKYRKNAREKEERMVVKHHDEMMKLKRQQGSI